MRRVIEVVLDPSGVVSGAARSRQALGGVETSTKNVVGAMRTLRTLAGTVIAALGVREVAAYADSWTLAANRIRLVTDSTDELATVQDELLLSANATRTSFESTVELYGRVARSADELGLSQRELLNFTTSVNQAIQVSGATATEAQAGIVQFAQGLASGALRGDELRSVLEQMPRLARALADGLGVSIGELRELGTEGALTTKVVLDALRDQAPQIADEFGKLTPTIQSAFSVINNQVGQAVDIINDATGASETLARELINIASNTDEVARAFTGTLRPADELNAQLRAMVGISTLLGTQLSALATLTTGGIGAVFETTGNAIGAFTASIVQRFRGNAEAAREINRLFREDAAATADELSTNFDQVTSDVADAFLRVSQLADANRRFANDGGAVDLETGGPGRPETGGGDDANDKQRESVARLIDALQTQADTFGQTAEQVALYRIQLAGANEQELALATQLASDLSILELSAEAAQDAADALEKRAEELKKNQESDQDFIAALSDEISLIGATRQELAEFEALQRLSADATDQQRDAVIGLVAELEQAAVAQEALEDQTRRYQEVAADAARATTGIFDDIRRGGSSAIDILTRLGERWADVILNAAVINPLEQGLTNVFSSSLGSGGFLGDLFGGLPGFATGGSFVVGGRGGTDQNVAAMRLSRGERVDITPAGTSPGGVTNIVNINGVNDFNSFRLVEKNVSRALFGAAQRETLRTA